MSAIKAFAEEVSVEMGLGGEITDAVMKEANQRLKDLDNIKPLDILRLLRKRQKLESDGERRELSDIRKKLMFILAPEMLDGP